MKLVITVGLVLVAGVVLGQKELSAEEIVSKSIEFCGGEERIGKVKTTSANYLMVQPDRSTAVVSKKIKNGQKYMRSLLSKTQVPQTVFYDGMTVKVVIGSTFAPVMTQTHKGEMDLELYSHVQYGYKAFGYKLKRLADEKFKNFDCYVVEATAPGRYNCINFFDKTNYRLIMVAYSDGSKALMVEYIFKDSVLFDSRILNTFPGNDQVQEMILQDVTMNADIPDVWFNYPNKGGKKLPPHIETGTFESATGVKTAFTRTDKTQDYYDESGKLALKRNLKWVSDDTFRLTDVNGHPAPESEFLVRIISWDDTGYVCHWIAGNYFDTNQYVIKTR